MQLIIAYLIIALIICVIKIYKLNKSNMILRSNFLMMCKVLNDEELIKKIESGEIKL